MRSIKHSLAKSGLWQRYGANFPAAKKNFWDLVEENHKLKAHAAVLSETVANLSANVHGLSERLNSVTGTQQVIAKQITDSDDAAIARLNETENRLDAELSRFGQVLGEFKQVYAQDLAEQQWNIRRLDEQRAGDFRKSEYRYYKSYDPTKYREALSEWYADHVGKVLDLDNPRTLSEKTQWLKLYDNNPLKTQYTDKIKAKELLSQKLGRDLTPTTLAVYDKYEDIDFDALPEKFVLKCNHGSGYNLVVTDKSQINHQVESEKFARWLNMDFAFSYGLELHYHGIPPKIMVEEFLDIDNTILSDVKILCFNGEPKYVEASVGWVSGQVGVAYYDLDWNRMPFTRRGKYALDEVACPDLLPEMIEIAKSLAEGFLFMRVDFLIVDGKCYLGELTFTPASGAYFWEDEAVDQQLGDLLQLH